MITSHGPFRESYTPAEKSSGWPAEAPGMPAADAAVSAERVRAAFSSPASAPAVLQPELPAGSPEVVAVEGAAEIPDDGRRQAETQRAKPALPGTGQEPPTTKAGGS